MKNQTQSTAWGVLKYSSTLSQMLTEVFTIHHLGTMNACTKFQGSLSNSQHFTINQKGQPHGGPRGKRQVIIEVLGIPLGTINVRANCQGNQTC